MGFTWVCIGRSQPSCRMPMRGFFYATRMLKSSASGVLVSLRSSTYPRGYASGLHSLRPCWTAFLSILLNVKHMDVVR
jgi:hypothetical protein